MTDYPKKRKWSPYYFVKDRAKFVDISEFDYKNYGQYMVNRVISSDVKSLHIAEIMNKQSYQSMDKRLLCQAMTALDGTDVRTRSLPMPKRAGKIDMVLIRRTCHLLNCSVSEAIDYVKNGDVVKRDIDKAWSEIYERYRGTLS